MKLKFKDLKKQIVEALELRLNNTDTFRMEKTGYTLIDGFVVQSIQSEPSGAVFGGDQAHMVMVVGNTTGLVYYFALKHLLPNLDI